MQLLTSRKILFYFFLIIFLTTFNNRYFSEIRFKDIDRIKIIGLEESEKQNLLKKLKFIKSKNIFFLNKIDIVNVLDANKIIENYTISKIYPSSLEIKIKKTKFLANVFNDGKLFLLGSNSKLIRSIEIKDDLPIIFGGYNKESFFNLLQSIENSNFKLSEIKNLYFFKSGRWDIKTNLDITIKLPRENLKDSLNLSALILNNREFKKINVLDLRQNDQVITYEK
tara:strand:+ start:911 stop:1585 length:675 start_codon:yes stop_codon:yes gene_type:complete